jgi:acetyltransferase-like isoleucine patch superfamily enzyme
MIIANKKPIVMIGFAESAMTQECWLIVNEDFDGEMEIVEPSDFLEMNDKDNYQYVVAFTIDKKLRRVVIQLIDDLDLDCVTCIHKSSYVYNADIDKFVGKGTIGFAYNTFNNGCVIGEHCIIECYVLISHYCVVGNNTLLHSGTMIAGKTTVGENSEFNFRSTVLNELELPDNIILGAASTLSKSIEKSGIYIGTPARRVGDFPTE